MSNDRAQALFDRWFPQAKRAATSFRRGALPRADAHQEAALALWEALTEYEGPEDQFWQTLGQRRIINRVNRAKDREVRNKMREQASGLCPEYGDGIAVGSGLEAECDRRRALASLTDLDKEILSQHALEEPPARIAKRLHVSLEHVRAVIQHSRRILE